MDKVLTEFSNLPKLHNLLPGYEGEAELILEWIFDKRRIGFAFENDPKESGWFWVDIRREELKADSGLFSEKPDFVKILKGILNDGSN